jgi:YD repeat-containing protein
MNVTPYKAHSWYALYRMTSLSGNGITASFTYDALGRRTTKTINGITQESDAKSARYTYGTGTDELLVINSATTKEYYLPDILGSVIALMDMNGATPIISPPPFPPLSRLPK